METAELVVKGTEFVFDGARSEIDAVLDKLRPSLSDLIPDGVRFIKQLPNRDTVLVYETPPAIQNLKWSDAGMYKREYKNIAIALPYVIIVMYLHTGVGHGKIGYYNECFFRNSPLTSRDDLLYYPALLNCSKYSSRSSIAFPLSWICVQHMVQPRVRTLRTCIDCLRGCLFDTGFNHSSDENELSSWYTESLLIDARLKIAAWQRETRKDPTFVLEIPWLETFVTLRESMERVAYMNGGEGARTKLAAISIAKAIVGA